MSEAEQNGSKEKTALIFLSAFVITILLIFSGVQTCRLQSSMEQLERYRTELEAAHNRQSDIRDNVVRTGEILSRTTNSVSELRKQIQEIEDSYNHLWEYCSDFNNITNYSNEEMK